MIETAIALGTILLIAKPKLRKPALKAAIICGFGPTGPILYGTAKAGQFAIRTGLSIIRAGLSIVGVPKTQKKRRKRKR